MLVLKCDACKAIFDEQEIDSSVLHFQKGNDYVDHMDLCPRCTKKMLHYLKLANLGEEN